MKKFLTKYGASVDIIARKIATESGTVTDARVSAADKPAWESPVLQLYSRWVAPDQADCVMDDAAYALSEQHQSDLRTFEAEVTAQMQAKGYPVVMIQPGDPGHAEAKKNAIKICLASHEMDEPYHPKHPRTH